MNLTVFGFEPAFINCKFSEINALYLFYLFLVLCFDLMRQQILIVHFLYCAGTSLSKVRSGSGLYKVSADAENLLFRDYSFLFVRLNIAFDFCIKYSTRCYCMTAI